MKFNFIKDQTVYYIDWQNGNKKIPAVIKTVKRTWADVYLKQEGIFKWKLTEVPMEDLEPTDDFVTGHDPLCGRLFSWVEKEEI